MISPLIKNTNGLMEILQSLPDSYYTEKLFVLDEQTIGHHCRHIIEHWQALMNGYESGAVNFANRKRSNEIETNRVLAIELIDSLQKASIKDNKVLYVTSINETGTHTSSYYREIDVVTEHVIHHSAIIRMAIISLDKNFKIPENFGYAPSTISFKQQCVQ